MPSWVEHTPEFAELIIVDNGSTDDSVAYLTEHYPNVRRIDFAENYGFALGYNKAIEMTECDVAVLLNSDVALTAGWLDEPVQILRERADVVAVQPKLRAYKSPSSFEYAGAAGGYLDRFGYPFCRGRIFDIVEEDEGQYDEPVDDLLWASGACLIIRRAEYLDVGGLDSRFFAHQEEIDLCWRLCARGWRIALSPKSVVYHVGGASLDASHPRKTYLNFRNNLLMLYKNLPKRQLNRILMWRIPLDAVAVLAFVLTMKWRHAWAVCRAHWDYHRLRRTFAADRSSNLSATVATPVGIKPYSLLAQYYLHRKRRYQDL